MSRQYVNPNSGRYAEPDELKRDYTEIPLNPETENKAAGLLIDPKCDADGYVIGGKTDGSDTNTIVLSAPGAGKTRWVVVQYILTCILALQNIIIHDPKGELYRFLSRLLKKKGYTIRVQNFRDPMTGERFNLLEDAARRWNEGEKGKALEIVKQIAKTIFSPYEKPDDIFWTETSINLFICLFIICASIYEPEYVTLEAIYKTHIEGLEKSFGKEDMLFYLEEYKNEKFYELGAPAIKAPNDTRGGIYSVFTSALGNLTLNDEITDMQTKSTFRIRDLASEKQPVALFLITRDESSIYNPLVSSMINLVYTELIEIAQSQSGGKLPKTCHFVLEEFCNLAKLHDINSMMTASRSRNIRLLLCVQSLAQLYCKYPPEEARMLVGNTQNLVYLYSTDMELVNMVSERCGTVTDPDTNMERRLLSPDRLTHLSKEKREALMLLGQHHPYITHLSDLTAYKMIEPLEKVSFPKRKKLQLEYGKFTKLVNELKESKEKGRANKNRLNNEETIRKCREDKKKRLEIPTERKAIMEEVIRREQHDDVS